MGTIIETEEDTIRLLENTHDSVKLTLDTGHMLFAQGDSLKTVSYTHLTLPTILLV